jgi:hypothetical protein
MTTDAMQARLSRLLDRTEIYDLVRFERFCRDQRDWPGLIGCFVKDGHVRTTWFDGTIEEFAEASRLKMSAGSAAKHWIFPAMLEIKDDRAIVESPAMIFDRLIFDGIEFDWFQYCRFFSRVVRTPDKGWRLASFEGIYQRDQMQTTNPADPLPVDWNLIKTLRPSYKFLAYVQLKRNYKVSPTLLGDDRPDLLETFYKRERRWLDTGEWTAP